MATPAERLSARKPWRRPKRNGPPRSARHLRWHCAIRPIREALKISLRDVADACGISISAYWQIEQGGDLRLVTARKLAEFFGRSEAELWPKRRQEKTKT